MYDLDGNYRFQIYWLDNPLRTSSFDYDKLNDLELRSLSVLDALWVVKVKDLLQMIDDPEQISNFLGNVHIFIYFSNMMSLVILFTDPGSFISTNMTNLKLFKRKKSMVEARERCGDQSVSKSDLTRIHTRAHKRKKLDVTKVAHVISEPHPTSAPTSEDPKPNSPKKMKTLMSDDVIQACLKITTLMQDSGRSHQSKPSFEFKYWSNSFDGLGYLYDHLNTTDDVEKVKSIGAQQLTQNLGPT